MEKVSRSAVEIAGVPANPTAAGGQSPDVLEDKILELEAFPVWPETNPALSEMFPDHAGCLPAHAETNPAGSENFPALPEYFPAHLETFPTRSENFSPHPEMFPVQSEI